MYAIRSYYGFNSIIFPYGKCIFSCVPKHLSPFREDSVHSMNFLKHVITSYSIHYTKLYDLTHDGEKSRIVATLDPGSGVVVPRSDVHYVVTEWGVAYLHGKSIRERAMQMIGIAHPKFRRQLLEEAKRLHFVYEDQMLPQTRDGVVVVYPEKYEWPVTTRGGISVFFRLV